jgi:hypothetical protein
VVGVKGRLILSTSVPGFDYNTATTPSKLFSVAVSESPKLSPKLAHTNCATIDYFALCERAIVRWARSTRELVVRASLCEKVRISAWFWH